MKTIALIKKICVVVIIAFSLVSLGNVTKQYTNQNQIFAAVFAEPEAYVALHIAYLDK